MSREAREWVWNEAPIDDPRKMLILLSLADVANETGGGAYPSKQRLARDSRSDPRTVQRHLKNMVDLGILEVEAKATQHRPTTYQIVDLRGDNLSPLDEPGETQGRRRGDTGETNTAPFPLIGTGTGKGKEIRALTTPLDTFWEIYPKRNGKRLYKEQASLYWDKLDEGERQLALVGARCYADACSRSLQIAKDPYRWIRDKLWVDWQTPAVEDLRKPRGPGRAAGMRAALERLQRGEEEK